MNQINLAEDLALKYFGIRANAKQLAGEIDLNFYLKTNSGEEYILKIAHTDADQENLNLQNEIMQFLSKRNLDVQLPVVLPNLSGETITKHPGDSGCIRFVRLLSWVEGRVLAKVNPHTPALLESLGRSCALIDKSLLDFNHSGAHRVFKWDVSQALWVKSNLQHIEDSDQNRIAQHFLDYFEFFVFPKLAALRKSVIYNDANDYNVLVSNDFQNPEIQGVIDFGDAIYTHTINELAIALAYALMGKEDPLEACLPLIKGYHDVFPLQENELEVLYGLVAARLLISVTSSAINKKQTPDNEYLVISEKPAWDLLSQWEKVSPAFAHYTFRSACGMEPCPKAKSFNEWIAANRGVCSFVLGMDLNAVNPVELDLSVGSLALGNNSSFDKIDSFNQTINRLLANENTALGYGGYMEVRPFYSTDAYLVHGNNGPQWRTVHLGFDLWAKAGTPVLAFFDGVVHSFADNAGERNYGPTIILEHQVNEELTFYTLYGHLNKECLVALKKGMSIKKGQEIAQIGAPPINGNWPPHLHFQLNLDMLDWKGDFPGVGFHHQLDVWKSLCPDSGAILGFEASNKLELDKTSIVEKRKENLSRNLSISYDQPLKMQRGYGQYLYEHTGRRFLDTVNNVAHVGHQHPRVVKAAQNQMAVLNTNTRYLHDNIVKYAEELLATFPPELSVCHFVNSGSEANELAMRMARNYTRQKDMLVVEVGYHGNTGGCIEISSYKFDGKGGKGAPDHVHVMPMPDTFRGIYRGEDAGMKYAQHLQKTIERLQSQGKGIAAFICESILSCGGQIVLPKNYLKSAYEYVRKAGGLCIADEVQVGFGRVGEHFWAFEMQGVIPDIVTMGKPIGNGHPLAAVVTTKAVSDAFANGMEYFNTFGGNPVSCAIGREVLTVIKEEGLQENAQLTGAYLRKKLLELKAKYPIIGDVRGPGFFQGIELIKDQNRLEPAVEQTAYLANRMREHAILMSVDGPHYNVLKIKPPMVFTKENVNFIIQTLDKIFKEDFMQISA